MDNLKKIALLCNYELLPERVGGMDYFFWEFDASCKRNNIQIDWFFPNKSNHGDYNKLTIYASGNQSIEAFFLDFSKKHEPTYTHIITQFVALCTPFFKKIKQLSTAEVIGVDHNPRPLKGYSLKKKIEKKVKGFLFSRYIDQFVGVSDYTVKEVIRDFGFHVKSKSKTIYNGVFIDSIEERKERNYNKPSFLVASHLRESKGIQDLIVAVSLLPTAILAEIEITVFGDGPYKEELIVLVQEHAVISNFKFMGSQANLNELYCKFDYMLQPTHMECFSLSILESLSANVPVITTSVGGNEEIIRNGENGFIFEPKDSNTLKDLIELIYLGNIKIESNTRKAIEMNFSLNKMVENHLQLLS
ncbi:glycosyltransferase family 4 protein [Flavobacterium sp. Arc3]|uniref:glycosyltransferase family 4 protein n=1 Tax=Flavobacterium sp. Arc3 TaxID=3046686 RepID=UPI00352F0033